MSVLEKQYVKLKPAEEIDFNKFNANFHSGYEEAERYLSRKKIYEVFDIEGRDGCNYRLKDLKGNKVFVYGNIGAFYFKYFKPVKLKMI